MRRLNWDRDPDINFWLDNDPIRLYFGVSALEMVPKGGISSDKIWVVLNLDPYTALRQGDYVIVLDIPPRWLMTHMDQRLGGNKKLQLERLLNKDLFLKWKKSDFEYYTKTEIHIAKLVPARYIVGYMENR